MNLIPLAIFAIYLIGIAVVLLSIDRNYAYFRTQMRKATRLNVRLKEKYKNDNLNHMMQNAGVPFSLYHFQVFRFSILFMLILSYMWKVGSSKELNILTLGFIIGFVILTQPSEKIAGIVSPFQWLLDVSLQRKRELYNEELYLAIAQMKNGFLINKENPPSSQHIFEEIRVYTNRTREVFNKFIRMWMVGDKLQAVDYFDREVGTKEAKKLSQVFLKLDDLNPSELREQLETFQSIYRTERETRKKKKNEMKSNVLFMAVLATAIMFLINFLVVGFFIDFITDMNDIL